MVDDHQATTQKFDVFHVVGGQQNGFACFLTPAYRILEEGNQAQQWLRQYEQGYSIPEIITQAIDSVYQQELELEDKLCQEALVA